MDEQRKKEISQSIRNYLLKRGPIIFNFDQGVDVRTAFKQLFEDVTRKTEIPEEEMAEWFISFLDSLLIR